MEEEGTGRKEGLIASPQQNLRGETFEREEKFHFFLLLLYGFRGEREREEEMKKA